jgi:glycosyltransferase involved in cell wall biosynthesis
MQEEVHIRSQAKPETGQRNPAKRKVRVLFIGAFPSQDMRRAGGVLTSCRALVDSRLAQEFDLDLIDSTSRSVPPPGVGTRALDAAYRFGIILWRLLRHRPDALLVFASPGLSFIEKSSSVLIAKMLGIPSLLFLRGGRFMDDCRGSRTYRRFAGALLRTPERLLCQGETWQQFFGAVFDIPAARCPIVRNWTATPVLLRVGAERSYKPRSPLAILFVGWLTEAKGLSELLTAFRGVALSQSVDCQLWLAGEGAASSSARAWAVDSGLADRVHFLGWVDEQEKTAAFTAADLFVLPSHVEGLPNALIEAMACGLPVITTPVGVIPDVIAHGENGILVPPKNPAALRAALEALLDSPAERERLGRAAYATAAMRFGLEDAVRGLSHALQSVVTLRTL